MTGQKESEFTVALTLQLNLTQWAFKVIRKALIASPAQLTFRLAYNNDSLWGAAESHGLLYQY